MSNKKIILSAFSIALVLVACSPKTSKSTAAATPVSLEPSEAMVTAGKAKFPDVTLDELKKGQTIYNGQCTKCHNAKRIEKRDEKEWISVLDEMAPKAKLLPEEKDAVWKYIMSVKLAAK